MGALNLSSRGPVVNSLARGTEPLAGFTVTDLQAGGLWWEIAVRGAGLEMTITGGLRELPDPAASPVLDPQGEPPHFPDQEEFDGLADPVRVPDELRDTLLGGAGGGPCRRDRGTGGRQGTQGTQGRWGYHRCRGRRSGGGTVPHRRCGDGLYAGWG